MTQAIITGGILGRLIAASGYCRLNRAITALMNAAFKYHAENISSYYEHLLLRVNRKPM